MSPKSKHLSKPEESPSPRVVSSPGMYSASREKEKPVQSKNDSNYEEIRIRYDYSYNDENDGP